MLNAVTTWPSCMEKRIPLTWRTAAAQRSTAFRMGLLLPFLPRLSACSSPHPVNAPGLVRGGWDKLASIGLCSRLLPADCLHAVSDVSPQEELSAQHKDWILQPLRFGLRESVMDRFLADFSQSIASPNSQPVSSLEVQNNMLSSNLTHCTYKPLLYPQASTAPASLFPEVPPPCPASLSSPSCTCFPSFIYSFSFPSYPDIPQVFLHPYGCLGMKHDSAHLQDPSTPSWSHLTWEVHPDDPQTYYSLPELTG